MDSVDLRIQLFEHKACQKKLDETVKNFEKRQKVPILLKINHT